MVDTFIGQNNDFGAWVRPALGGFRVLVAPRIIAGPAPENCTLYKSPGAAARAARRMLETGAAPRAGAPKKGAGEKYVQVSVRLPPAEHDRFEAARRSAGLSTGAMLTHLMDAAGVPPTAAQIG